MGIDSGISYLKSIVFKSISERRNQVKRNMKAQNTMFKNNLVPFYNQFHCSSAVPVCDRQMFAAWSLRPQLKAKQLFLRGLFIICTSTLAQTNTQTESCSYTP